MGFLNTLYEVIKNEEPTHIGVAFDLGAPTLRTDAFLDYKANREETPPDIKISVPYIKEIIKRISPEATWYFTSFESNDKTALRIKKIKLRNYGFKGTFGEYLG